jgi:chemotaxis protein methyltransferase CheR
MAESVLTQLSEYIAARLGLHFPPRRWPDLLRSIGAITSELAFPSEAACIEWLMGEPRTTAQIDVLARHLTVEETYFFREPAAFTALREQLLPALLQARQGTTRRLQLWSAGCATGEEPYSLAILLHTLMPALQHWQVTLLATDINTRSLERAAAGVYGAWSFRSAPPWLRDRYFTRRGDGRYAILPEIKNLVTFTPLNLVADFYPAPWHPPHTMDVIFCRNVLMYFTPAQAERVVHRLYQLLAPGGWLVVSPCETSHTLFARFRTVNFPGSILYQKAPESSPTPASGTDGGRYSVGASALPPPLPLGEGWGEGPPALDQLPSPYPSGATVSAQGAALPGGRGSQSQRVYQPTSEVPEVLTLYAQGCYAEAAEQLAERCRRQHATAADMALLARVYANWGQLAAARAWIEKAIAADKITASFHYLHATILQEQGELEAAMAALNRVLYLDRNLVLAHVALGNLALRQQRDTEAARHFQNARCLLRAYQPDEALPEAEGLTAGRLMAMMRATTSGERFA